MQIGLLSQVPTIVHRLIRDKHTEKQTKQLNTKQVNKYILFRYLNKI
jgi:hypothetical protein